MSEPLASTDRGEQRDAAYNRNLMAVVVNEALAQFRKNLGCSRRIRIVGSVEEHDVHKRAPERVRKSTGVFNLASLWRIHLTLKYPCEFSNYRCVFVEVVFSRIGTGVISAAVSDRPASR